MDTNDIMYKLCDVVISDYYNSLKILLANRDWFPRFPDEKGNERIVIVQLINMNEEAKEAIHLAAQKWKDMVESFRLQEDVHQKINEFLDRLKLLLSNNPLQLSANMLSKELTEAITGDLLEQCLMKYQAQEKFFDDPNVLRQLSSSKLKLIEPWVQASVCGHCHIFELLLSSLPKRDSKCPNCERDMSIARMYRLHPQFELHKLENKDLALFIASYIQRKKPKAAVEVSKKILKASSSDITTDIDVCIPSIKTGIECKLFVNLQPQGTQFDSYAGELASNLSKYAQNGMERLIAITNLPENEVAKMSSMVEKSLHDNSIRPKYFRIGYFSFENLKSILDEEIKEIEKTSKSTPY